MCPGFGCFPPSIIMQRGQDNVAIRYGLDGLGIESRWGRDFPHPFRAAMGPTQAAVQWVRGLICDDKKSHIAELTNFHCNYSEKSKFDICSNRSLLHKQTYIMW
jgi:hypothetical protein